MTNDNTNEFDTIFPTYNTWEEIPVSTLKFYSNTSQICYIALPKEKAQKAVIEKAIPINTRAYEYIDEVPIKQNEVVLGIVLDTTNMLDLTHKPEYKQYLLQKMEGQSIQGNVPLIRKAIMDNEFNHIKIVYNIRNNECVRKVEKIQFKHQHEMATHLTDGLPFIIKREKK